MKKVKDVNYFQAVRDFDKAHGRKQKDFDTPVRNRAVPDAGVDYLTVSRAYEQYLKQEHSDAVHGEKG